MTDTNMEKKTYTTEMISGAEALFSRLREAAKHDGTASFPFLQAVQFEIDEMRKAARPAPQMGEDWVDEFIEAEMPRMAADKQLVRLAKSLEAPVVYCEDAEYMIREAVRRALSTRVGVDVERIMQAFLRDSEQMFGWSKDEAIEQFPRLSAALQSEQGEG